MRAEGFPTEVPESLIQPEDVAAEVLHLVTLPETAYVREICIRPGQQTRHRGELNRRDAKRGEQSHRGSLKLLSSRTAPAAGDLPLPARRRAHTRELSSRIPSVPVTSTRVVVNAPAGTRTFSRPVHLSVRPPEAPYPHPRTKHPLAILSVAGASARLECGLPPGRPAGRRLRPARDRIRRGTHRTAPRARPRGSIPANRVLRPGPSCPIFPARSGHQSGATRTLRDGLHRAPRAARPTAGRRGGQGGLAPLGGSAVPQVAAISVSFLIRLSVVGWLRNQAGSPFSSPAARFTTAIASAAARGS